MGQLFTIGCSTHTEDEFVFLLKQHKVGCLVDVRSVPYSAYTPQFNRENLMAFLQKKGIFYIDMGKSFGAQREERELYSLDKDQIYVDFVKVSWAEIFQQGIARVETGLKKGFNIALMCTEKDPFDCHRAILVAHNFAVRGTDVQHILWDGSFLPQEKLDEQVVRYYRTNFVEEGDLFSDKMCNSDAMYNLLEMAYLYRGKEIAYRKQKKEADDESLYHGVCEEKC